MKRIILSILLFTFIGCGGSGGSDTLGLDPSLTDCSFELSDYFNGPNSNEATSIWDCNYETEYISIQFFADGTGFSSRSGSFTWSQIGCNSLDYKGALGDGSVSDINGTKDVFTAKGSFKGKTYNASCSRVEVTPDESGTYKCISGCNTICAYDSVIDIVHNEAHLEINSPSYYRLAGPITSEGTFDVTSFDLDIECEGTLKKGKASITCSSSLGTCQTASYENQ